MGDLKFPASNGVRVQIPLAQPKINGVLDIYEGWLDCKSSIFNQIGLIPIYSTRNKYRTLT